MISCCDAFLCIYDVIRLHQVSGSSNYDDVMTKQVPGVSGANLIGRHLPSVPNPQWPLVTVTMGNLGNFKLTTDADRHTSIRACRAASSQPKINMYKLQKYNCFICFWHSVNI